MHDRAKVKTADGTNEPMRGHVGTGSKTEAKGNLYKPVGSVAIEVVGSIEIDADHAQTQKVEQARLDKARS